MRVKTMSGALMFLVVAGLLSAAPGYVCAEVRTEIHWGEAKDEDGNLLYREKHEVKYDNGRVQNSLTSYRDPSGREFATLESDYRLSVVMPTYVFEDYRSGHKEGLRFEGGRYYIFDRDSEEEEKAKVLDDDTNVYSCQGWHYYLVDNLERVEGGDDLIVRLIFPNRLRPYTFKILSMGSEGDTVKVKVRIANWLLSLFVPHLEVVYDKNKRKLIEYYGVSNIVDADGELQKVHITYQY
jgi:hypothetical protein